MMSEVLQPIHVDEASLGLRRHRRRRAGRALLRDRAHARALRDRVLPAADLRLAQLRDVAGGRRADRHGAGERGLEAAPRRVRAAAARPGASPRRSTRSSHRRKREIDVGRRLEPQLVDVEDPVRVVDDEGLAPQLECGARMRDPEPDQVADRERSAVRQLEERVLVVELRDREPGSGPAARTVPSSAADLDDDRQVLVGRQVASPGAGDREARLRRGDDRRPDLDRGLQPGRPRRRAHPERGAALVDAMIVGDIGAAAQDDPDRQRQ